MEIKLNENMEMNAFVSYMSVCGLKSYLLLCGLKLKSLFFIKRQNTKIIKNKKKTNNEDIIFYCILLNDVWREFHNH